MNKKDTMGRKCHRRNAQEIICFSQRFSADRETLSRVLQSALVAGQGTHTVQEASHGHSSMRQERGPRLDMELVDGSGKGVGEEESGRADQPTERGT